MGSPRLWHNGRVFTGGPWAEAILVDDGRVVAVGSADEVRRSAPTGTEVSDLGGHLILPGLIDAHLHLAEMTWAREGPDVEGARSVPELLDRVRNWAAAHPMGFVIGRGWSAERLGRSSPPTRRELDGAVDGRPLILYHASGHAVAVNSAALAAVRIDARTPDPAGGRIGRDPDGEPNGALYETAMRALAPVYAGAPLDSGALGRTVDSLRAQGITTVASMNVGSAEVESLRALAANAHLSVRARLYLNLGLLDAGKPAELGVDPSRLEIVGVKGFTDGAFGPRTASLSTPYADAPAESGLPSADDDRLSGKLEAAASLGLAPALHAIGDEAVGRALDLLEPMKGRTTAPIRLEHAALTPPELLPRIDRVRPSLVVQPGFVWSDHWLGDRLGRERARWAYAFRTLATRGHRLAGSSDAPYDPADPWRGLNAAVHRRDPEGRSANPDTSEAIPVEEAIRMYTQNGGLAVGEPGLGWLMPGAPADFLLLSVSDLPGALTHGAAAVRETWLAGAPVGPRDGAG
jgi:predicted amidohydrolase YtcJ